MSSSDASPHRSSTTSTPKSFMQPYEELSKTPITDLPVPSTEEDYESGQALIDAPWDDFEDPLDDEEDAEDPPLILEDSSPESLPQDEFDYDDSNHVTLPRRLTNDSSNGFDSLNRAVSDLVGRVHRQPSIKVSTRRSSGLSQPPTTVSAVTPVPVTSSENDSEVELNQYREQSESSKSKEVCPDHPSISPASLKQPQTVPAARLPTPPPITRNLPAPPPRDGRGDGGLSPPNELPSKHPPAGYGSPSSAHHLLEHLKNDIPSRKSSLRASGVKPKRSVRIQDEGVFGFGPRSQPTPAIAAPTQASYAMAGGLGYGLVGGGQSPQQQSYALRSEGRRDGGPAHRLSGHWQTPKSRPSEPVHTASQPIPLHSHHLTPTPPPNLSSSAPSPQAPSPRPPHYTPFVESKPQPYDDALTQTLGLGQGWDDMPVDFVPVEDTFEPKVSRPEFTQTKGYGHVLRHTMSQSSSHSSSSSSTGPKDGSSSTSPPTRSSATPPPAEMSEEKRQKSLLTRKHICHEIYETEKNYAQMLTILVQQFRTPFNASIGTDPIVSPVFIRIVFAYIEDLTSLSLRFAEELTKLTEHWDDNVMVGRLFLKYEGEWELFLKYVDNYSAGQSLVRQAEEQSQAYRDFNQKARASRETNRQELNDFLILPIQRATRYSLLLKDMRKHTPEDHPDFADISNALARMTELAATVNRVKQHSEETTRMFEVHKLVENTPAFIITFARRLILEADVMELKSSKGMRLFLYSDLLMIARHLRKLVTRGDRFKFVRVLDLRDIDIAELEDGHLKMSIDPLSPSAKSATVNDATMRNQVKSSHHKHDNPFNTLDPFTPTNAVGLPVLSKTAAPSEDRNLPVVYSFSFSDANAQKDFLLALRTKLKAAKEGKAMNTLMRTASETSKETTPSPASNKTFGGVSSSKSQPHIKAPEELREMQKRLSRTLEGLDLDVAHIDRMRKSVIGEVPAPAAAASSSGSSKRRQKNTASGDLEILFDPGGSAQQGMRRKRLSQFFGVQTTVVQPARSNSSKKSTAKQKKQAPTHPSDETARRNEDLLQRLEALGVMS